MRKQPILILTMLFFILTISCVSAVDNDTNIVTEQNTDAISINEEDMDNLSISEEENGPVGAINEDNTTILTVTNDGTILAGDNNSEVLTVSSEHVLSIEVNVTPLSSSNYKTPTKKQRTFNIGGFKAVLSKSQYKKLYQASSIEYEFFENGYNDYYYVGEKFKGYYVMETGLMKAYQVKTNKYVKIKIKSGKKYKTKKSRVYMVFRYGAGDVAGFPYVYTLSLTIKDGNALMMNGVKCIQGKNRKYFDKTKAHTSFTKLKKSPLYSNSYLYKELSAIY